jgi:hypothetical protein
MDLDDGADSAAAGGGGGGGGGGGDSGTGAGAEPELLDSAKLQAFMQACNEAPPPQLVHGPGGGLMLKAIGTKLDTYKGCFKVISRDHELVAVCLLPVLASDNLRKLVLIYSAHGQRGGPSSGCAQRACQRRAAERRAAARSSALLQQRPAPATPCCCSSAAAVFSQPYASNHASLLGCLRSPHTQGVRC